MRSTVNQSGLFFPFFLFFFFQSYPSKGPGAIGPPRPSPGGPGPRATGSWARPGAAPRFSGVFVPLSVPSACGYSCDFPRGPAPAASRRTRSAADAGRPAARARAADAKCAQAPAEPGAPDSLLILQSKQANVMCITLAVSLKVSAALLISRAAFWGHSDAGISAVRGEQDVVANKDSIYKGC